MRSQVKPLLKPLKGGKAAFEVVKGGFVMGHYVPKGMVTDLDSVPRVPVVHALFKSRSTLGALLHDHLYKTGMYSRKEADDIFYGAMIWEGVGTGVALVIHRAVRIFGRSSYKNRTGECNESKS